MPVERTYSQFCSPSNVLKRYRAVLPGKLLACYLNDSLPISGCVRAQSGRL